MALVGTATCAMASSLHVLSDTTLARILWDSSSRGGGAGNPSVIVKKLLMLITDEKFLNFYNIYSVHLIIWLVQLGLSSKCHFRHGFVNNFQT